MTHDIPAWWTYVASAPTSLLVGITILAILAYKGRLSEAQHWGPAGILSITLYTVAVLLAGHLFFKIDVAASIHAGFSSERFCWLMVGFALDGFGRFYTTFIAPRPPK